VRTFDYVRPADAAEASARLRDGARAMGGGTDVLTQLDRGILPADEVVDLRALGLSGIAHDGGGLRIGATTSVAEVERDPGIGERFAGLRQAAAAVGSPQLREMGTVGGNL
jgi:CO/xanthine dehydrogenase FAD-binding subunit